MKKLLSVLLITLLIASAIAVTLPVNAAGDCAVIWSNLDTNDNHSDQSAFTIWGWVIAGNGEPGVGTYTMTSFGYKIDNCEPKWKVTGISANYGSNSGATWRVYHSGEATGHETTYHGYFYRVGGEVTRASIAADYGISESDLYGTHKITFLGKFVDTNAGTEIVLNLFTKMGGQNSEQYFIGKWDLSKAVTLNVDSGSLYSGGTGTASNVNAQTFTNNVVVTGKRVDGAGISIVTIGDDPFVAINLPNVKVGYSTAVKVRYRASTAAAKNVYMMSTTGTTAYSAGTGNYCSPVFIGDGEWHTAVYNITPSSALKNFANKTLTGIRIPGADGVGSIMEIESIVFEHWIGRTNVDEMLNHKGIGFSATVTNPKDIQLGDVTQKFKDSFGLRGWVASNAKIEQFGYLIGDNYTFGSYKAPTEQGVINEGKSVAGSAGESVRYIITGIPRINGTDEKVSVVARLTNDLIVKVADITYSATDEAWIAPPVSLANSNVDAIEMNGTALNDIATINGGNWLAAGNSIIVVGGEQNVLNIRGWTQVANGTITAFGYKIDSDAWVDSASYIHERSADLAAAGVVSANGFNYFNIPLASLDAGAHTIKFRVKAVDENNVENIFEFFTVPLKIVNFRFSRASSTIESGNNIDLKFKADKDLFTIYTDPYVTFDGGDPVYGTVDGDYVVFTYSGIDPTCMDTDIDVVLHATRNSADQTYEMTYSLADYCAGVVSSSEFSDELKTLVVDMLNYGAAVQTYCNVTATANTGADQSYATADANALALTNDYNVTSLTEGKKARWKAVALKLEDEVSIKYTFEITDTTADNVSVSFTYTNVKGQQINVTRSLAECKDIGNNSYVCYLELPACEMRSVVAAVIKSGDTVISSTLDYSIVSYAYSQINAASPDANLAALLKEMMKFGDSAKNYVLLP